MQPTPLRAEPHASEPTSWSAVPVLTLALRALGERALLWTVTLGAGAIWTYTALTPDRWRLITAAAYSVTVLWPFLWRDRRGGE